MSRSKQPVEAKDLPHWVNPYFEQAYESQMLLAQVVSVSRRGMAGVVEMPRLSKAVARVSGKERTSEHIAALEEEAALAKSEVEKDFPVLHSLAAIGLWSWLEHLVKGLAVEWLLHNKKSMAEPAFQKLKIKIGEYAVLTRREQAAYLVELLEQDTSASLKQGINRFESILQCIDLSGKVSDRTARSIFELQQIRNVIAHRNGVCDRRLRTSCPWLKYKIGQPIRIGASQLGSYVVATTDYALSILFRVGDRYGVELRSHADDT